MSDWQVVRIRPSHRAPLDGLLELFDWYGKAFETTEIVHPLLFLSPKGDIFSVDAAHAPLHLALS